MISFTQHQEDKCAPSTPTPEQLFGFMSLLPPAFVLMTMEHPGAVYCLPCETPFVSQRQLDLHNKATYAPFKKGKNKVSKTELMKPFTRGGNDLDLLNQEILSHVGKQFFENSKANKQTENKQDENEPRDNKQDGKEQDGSTNPPPEKKRRGNRKERKPIETTKSGVEQRGKASEAQGSAFNCPVCDKSFRLESALGQHRTMKHAYTENVTEQAKVAAEVPTQPEVASTLPDASDCEVLCQQEQLPNSQDLSKMLVPVNQYLWDDLNTRSFKSPTGYLFQSRDATDSTVLVDRQVDLCRLVLGNAKFEHACSRIWKD